MIEDVEKIESRCELEQKFSFHLFWAFILMYHFDAIIS